MYSGYQELNDTTIATDMGSMVAASATPLERTPSATSLRVLIVKLGWTESFVSDAPEPPVYTAGGSDNRPGHTSTRDSHGAVHRSHNAECSLGDVLRTTPILHLFADDHVTWLTDRRAVPLLPGSPYIDELVVYGSDAHRRLMAQQFDVGLNLERNKRLATLLQRLDCAQWRGFSIDRGVTALQHIATAGGSVPYPAYMTIPRHEVALPGGDSDKVTASEQRMLEGRHQSGQSWPEILYDLAGARYEGQPMVLGHTPRTTVTHDIGFNVQVGPKWPTKAWPVVYWQRLQELLGDRWSIDYQRCLNDLEGYIDWINQCRVLVTNDSLGLHVAQALGKITIGLFGPTSAATIPDSPHLQCLSAANSCPYQPCYKSHCERDAQCMRALTPEQVAEVIERVCPQ